MKGLMKFRASAALLAACGLVVPVFAQTYTVANLNSTVQINATGSSAGMPTWLVDGVNNVKQQWFYFRIGDSGPELPINSMGNLTVASRTDLATLDLTYADLPSSPNYQARVQYLLTGLANGSGRSTLGETVTFYNTSASSLNLRFFDYSDFDVAGIANNDSVTLSRTALGPPSNKTYNTSFVQTLGAFSVNSSAVSGTNNTAHLEANYYSTTLSSLVDGNPTTLNDTFSKTSGDLTAALEWDVTLAPGTSLLISKTISLVVPEPSATTLVALGFVAWGILRRNRD